MARVYVSSTYQDLKECREVVRLALQRLRQDDVAMETYVAEPQRPLDRCLADVAACDLYVGVFAWRYGYLPPGHDQSITELEYRAAVRHGKPCLIFLLHEDAPWPRSAVEKGPGADRIEAFRAQLLREHTCGIFTSCQDLAAQVTAAVSNWLAAQGQPAGGHGALSAARLATYYERLQQQYGRLDLDALTPPQREEYLQIQLRSVFVEPSVREELPPLELPKELWRKLHAEGSLGEDDLPAGLDPLEPQRAQHAYRSRPPRRVLDVVTEPAAQRAVLLGDPGAGKSTLARYLVLSLTTAAGDERLARLEQHLPILVELRAYAALKAKGTCGTFLEFLDHLGRTEGLGLDQAALDDHLTRDGRALVVFDGLDEVFDPEDRDEIARQIAGFAARYPKARVLVTSRVVGYRRARLGDAGFTHFTLQDLDQDQIAEFLTSWYTLALHDRPDEAVARRERLVAAIGQVRAIRELAGNPLLLTILAIVAKHQELPRERWKVYDHAAAVLVEHWDVNRHLRDHRIQHAFLGEEDKKELLRRVAHRMQAGTAGLAGNYLTAEELREEFESYLTARYQLDPAQAKVVATAMLEQFRERSFILSRYGPGVYGFVHRAFLEFFCALAIVWRLEKRQELTREQLKREVFGRRWSDPAWSEVLRLIVGMVDEQFAGELIGFLATDAYRPWPPDFGDRPPRNVVLAVQCLGEVRNLGAVREQAERVLRVLICLFEHTRRPADDPPQRVLEEELVAAAVVIGAAWPGRELYLDWYQSSRRTDRYGALMSGAAELGAVLFPGSTELRDQFLDMVRSGQDRYRELTGIRALAQMAAKDSDTMTWLRAQGGHEHAGVRAAAVDAVSLAKSDDPETVRWLQDLLATEDEQFVLFAAMSALGRLAEEHPEVLRWLHDLATDNGRIDIRYAAISALGPLAATDPDTLALFRELASDMDAIVRRAVLQALALATTLDRTTVALLRELATTDRDAEVRALAARALGQAPADDLDTRVLLGNLTADKAPLMRQMAIFALQRAAAEDPDTRSLLRHRLATERDSYVRQAAAEVLGRAAVTDPAADTVLRELATADDDVQVRWTAIRALGRVAETDLDASAFLRDLVTDEHDRQVRRAAAQALAQALRTDRSAGTPGRHALAFLRDLAAGDKDIVVRRTAVELLGRMAADDPDTVTLLHHLAGDDDRYIRQLAVAGLGAAASGDPATLALLRDRAATDDDSLVREAAILALGPAASNDGDTLAFLKELAVTDHPGIRLAAIRAVAGARPGDPDTLRWLLEPRPRVVG